jgi:general secretion pathway protein D
MNRNTLNHRSVFFTVIALALSTCGTAFAQKTADDDPIEMVSRRLRLSYVDPTRCTQLLKLYGITIGSVTAAVDPKKLPVVVALPETKFHEIVPASSGTFPRTETDPLSELMVFYDSSEPSQFGRIVRVVREQIDIPARKIMIEAMVLEISSTALKELGVQWDLTGNAGDGNFVSRHLGKAPLTIGKIRELVPSAKNVPQLDFSVTNAFREFNFRLQALVKEGSAEVLSRPSVLTLDNRMAYINVSEKIPIATTKFAKDFISAVDFREVTAGIELAVRPRINEDGSEVSMQINASVSARVPGENNEVKDKDGNLLATAPTLSIREVKTYARIANDTPFIIGGLIAKDSAETVNSVPILGKIPILGALFRSKSKTGLKREVIIVITPSVLPEENVVNKSMPKDEDLFDSFDHRLFRDAYRIRDEDTFDLRYLTENRGLLKLQAIADRIVTDDVRLAEAYPYNRFADRAVPGEDALVRRQIYEVLKHREAAEKLDARKLIFFRKDEDLGTGFRVRFLSEHLEEVAPFVLSNKKTGKAFALRYQFRRDSASASELLEEPVPEMAIVDCPDKATWRRLLWELNQPGPKGEVRRVIILRNRDDLERLKFAVLMKKTIELNTEKNILQLKSFTRGRLLRMPTVREDDVELIDFEVAACFFHSEQYYAALQSALRRDYAAFNTALLGTQYEELLRAGQ